MQYTTFTVAAAAVLVFQAAPALSQTTTPDVAPPGRGRPGTSLSLTGRHRARGART